jgi:hypothetical protein
MKALWHHVFAKTLGRGANIHLYAPSITEVRQAVHVERAKRRGRGPCPHNAFASLPSLRRAARRTSLSPDAARRACPRARSSRGRNPRPRLHRHVDRRFRPHPRRPRRKREVARRAECEPQRRGEKRRADSGFFDRCGARTGGAAGGETGVSPVGMACCSQGGTPVPEHPPHRRDAGVTTLRV